MMNLAQVNLQLESPEAGDAGGYLVGQGTPEAIAKLPKSHTGKYLVEKLK